MVISTLLNPSLLIADEVTSALRCIFSKGRMPYDKRIQRCRYKSNRLSSSRTIISVLYQIADRIMIMYAGKVAEIGKTQQIASNPVHPYTKMLMSSLPEIGIRYTHGILSGIPGQPPQLLNPPTGCRSKRDVRLGARNVMKNHL